MAVASDQAPATALRGIFLMILAGAMFACLDATAKYLGANVGIQSNQVVWLRYTSHVILLALFLRVWRDLSPFKTRRPLLQFVRGMALLGSTFFNFWALNYLQLAQTSAIMFASPLIVTALAGPVLGETVGVRRWAAVLVGFVGILVVTRPGSGAMHWAILLSLCSVSCYSLYALMTRRMHRTESSEALLMLSACVGVAVLAPYGPGAVMALETWQLWVLAFMMGAFGGGGHYALVVAHKHANASVLAPFIYFQMVWMITFGFVIFGDAPDVYTLVGSAIIAGSGLYILHRERIRRLEALALREPPVR